MEISIVITNWNGINILKDTLPTVLDAAVQDVDHIYEILLVDDCSTDDSVSYVKTNFSHIRVIKTPQNMGYMAANNFGVQNARFPLVFCLNNDMKINASTIPSLVKHFSDPRVFAASGKIFDWENHFLYGNRGGTFEKGHFSYFEKDPDDTYSQTLFACGGAFLCRKNLYLELGGYDAELYSPYYYDETDLCFRALKKGYPIIYEPRSVAFHKERQTVSRQYDTTRVKIISARNNYFFSLKNIHDPVMTRDMLIYIPLFLIRDAFKFRFRFWKAFWEVLKRLPFVLKRRKQEKQKGGLSAEEIFKAVNRKHE
ncbi:MAG: glycosyltransferase family 2 protein [Candidatus Aureabacteria bacterium]|nr:glycosyltransferase family 2 protein [Candidatus Auribacterota bacterium]